MPETAKGDIPAADNFSLAPHRIFAALEALLFAAGDPLPVVKISQVIGLPQKQVRHYLIRLSEHLAGSSNRGLLLREVDDAFFFATKPDYSDVLERLYQPRNRPALSQAAYETLAVVAYNQPVTRAQVESVRGVNSDSIISRLIERNLLQEAGQLDAPGRPFLYETTEQFLISFGLTSVRELPPMEMLMYKTLQEFEASLHQPAEDRQISLEQLIEPPAEHELAALEESTRSLSADDMLAVSEVLFGSNTDPAQEETN